MAVDPLILVANPGSASRKYALYSGDECLVKIHFEHEAGKIIFGFEAGGRNSHEEVTISNISFAAGLVGEIIQKHSLLPESRRPDMIALRVVAPGADFQQDLKLDDTALNELANLESLAPLHINATLQEAHLLKKSFKDINLVGISDSAFHSSLPDHASHYGLSLDLAESYGIKRYGYQGLSVESTVETLRRGKKLPLRLIVCHLGSGSSVTAVRDGKSIDTTMGYSPLEGLIMASRSGNLDVVAAKAVKQALSLDDDGLTELLYQKSGLLGISGKSADIRELLELEANHLPSELALRMYVYRICQAVGQMSAVLGGCDALVFTGTVGERSAIIRQRIIKQLAFLGLYLDASKNHQSLQPKEITLISPDSHPAKIYVVPADEGRMIAKHAAEFGLS